LEFLDFLELLLEFLEYSSSFKFLSSCLSIHMCPYSVFGQGMSVFSMFEKFLTLSTTSVNFKYPSDNFVLSVHNFLKVMGNCYHGENKIQGLNLC
jgi:hypothetical protein